MTVWFKFLARVWFVELEMSDLALFCYWVTLVDWLDLKLLVELTVDYNGLDA